MSAGLWGIGVWWVMMGLDTVGSSGHRWMRDGRWITGDGLRAMGYGS